MAKVSLSKAAKDTGVSLPTLSRWRSSGKISAEKNGSGGYIIDTAEYDRIIDLIKTSRNRKGVTKPIMKGTAPPIETPNEMKGLLVEVEVLRERIKDKDLTIDDLKEDRNEWKKQAQTLLLQSPSIHSFKAEEQQKEVAATPLPENKNNTFTKHKNKHSEIYLFLIATLLVLGLIFGIAYLMHEKQNQPSNLSKSNQLQTNSNTSITPPPNFYFQQQLETE